MARLKKSLALLLAIVMMFGSMSVAASATYGMDNIDDNDIRFQVVFYRKAEDGSWIRTNRVAPNEEVEARLYLETTFPAAAGDLAFFFNEKYFTQLHSQSDLQVVENVSNNPNYPSAGNSFGLSTTAVWRKDATKFPQIMNGAIEHMADIEQNPNFIITDADGNRVDYFDVYDAFTANLKFAPLVPATPYSVSRNENGELTDPDNDWVMAFSLKVNSNEITTSTDAENVNLGGDAFVPELYNSKTKQNNEYESDDIMFVDFAKYVLGDIGRSHFDSMNLWDPEFETIPGTVTTITNLTFNANGGTLADNSKVTTIPGIIGQPFIEPENIPERENFIFKGWVYVPQNILDEAALDKRYDINTYLEGIGEDNTPTLNPYEDATYYALWEAKPDAELTLTVNSYVMDTDGNYIQQTPDVSDATALVGQTVNRPASIVHDGFYIDEEISDKSVTISQDNSSNVLDVYYARKNYTVNYYFEDALGAQTETYDVRKVTDKETGHEKFVPYYYGAAFPELGAATFGTVPAPVGYHFAGWSTTPVAKGDEESATFTKLPTTIDNLVDSSVDPENRVYDLYAVYEENTYTYTFYAYAEEDATRTGSFSDNKQIITYQFEYGEATDAAKNIEAPVRDGYSFEGWEIDIPATVSGDLDFYPIYNQGEHVVEFWAIQDDSGEYTKLDEAYIGYGDELKDIHVPADYPTVNSWALADDTIVNFPYTITEDTVLYLVEGKNVYPVDFYVDGELYESIPTIFDTEVKAPAENPSTENGGLKPGYNFVMWDGFSEGMLMDSTSGMRFDAVTEKKDITLTFVVDGAETEVTGKFDTEVPVDEIPEIPAKEGYEAGNWSPAAPDKFPAEDTTYTAEWTPKKITLTFVDVIDGVESTLGTMTGDAETEIAEPQKNPEKKGYTFNGWKVENNEANVIETAPTAYPTKDTKYYASWDINKYNYNIDLNGGNINGSTEAVSATDVPFGTVVELKAPVMEGNTFLGWADANGEDDTIVISKEATSFVLEGDTSLKAVWSTDEYTVTFKSGADDAWVIDNNGIKHSSITIPVKYGEEITVPTATRDKYTFADWNEDSLNITVPELMPAKNLVFTAQWDKIPQNVEYEIYAVKEIPGTDGEYTAPVLVGTYTGTEGEKVEVYFGAPDAEFAAENTHDWGTLIDDDSQIPDTENENNSAKIEALVDGQKGIITVYYKLASFDITFNAGAGAAWKDGDPSKTVEDQKYGYVINTPETDPEKTGYVFGGWEDANKDKLTDATTVTGDATYTAIWTPEKHVAHFIVVDGENNPIADIAEITAEYDYNATISAPQFTLPEKYQSGYAFTTWVINPDKMGTEDLYYYATLIPVDYKVTYVVSGADVTAPATQYANVGDEVNVAKAPEADGYTFSGWTDAEGKSYSADGKGTLIMPAGDVTLTGTYTGIKYTINIDSNGIGGDKYVEITCGDTVTTLPQPNESEIPADTKFEGIFDENGEKIVLPFEMTAGNKNYSYGWSYKVSYEYAGVVPATAAELPAEAYVMPGTSVVIADEPAAVEGYNFLGWTIDGADAADFTMDNRPVKIIGKWEAVAPDEATITYAYANAKPEGAADAHGPDTAVIGSNIYVKSVPSAEGYTFDGWYAGGVMYAAGEEITVTGDIAFTGTWNKITPKYTLTLDPNEGTLNGSTEVFSEEYEEGTEIPPVATPERDGYRFDGWVGASGIQDVPSEMPGNDVSLTAKWTQVFDVVYQNEDGTVYEEFKEAGAAGEALPAPANNPTKDGSVFVKWVDAETGEEISAIPEGGAILKPVFEAIIPNTSTITYEFTGDVPAGVSLPGAVQASNGSQFTAQSIVNVKGYEFKGWTLNGVPTSSFIVENDVTLKGEWVVLKYDIILNADGGKFTNGASQFSETNVAYGTSLSDIIPASPEKEGYEFGGWLDEENNEYVIPSTMPNHDIKLKADWDIKSYTITFDSKGGNEIAPETFEFNAVIDKNKLPVPVRDGYEFTGWTDADGKALPANMPAENIMAYATWKPEESTVTYDLTVNAGANGRYFDKDGNEVESYVEKLVAGDNIADFLKVPVADDGYVFAGWDGIPADGKMPEAPVTVTAKWEKVVEKHSVTYYFAKGDTTPIETKEYAAGEAIINPEDPALEGFTFIGWFDEHDEAIPDVMEDEDIVAYAKFEVNYYILTYIVDGEVIYQDEVAYSSEVYIPEDPTPTDPETVFAGWSPAVETTMPAKDMTYVAKFAPIEEKTYMAKFLSDGRTVGIDFAKEGEAIEVPEDPTKFGFKFVGWEPEVPDAMPAHDMTFEAQWEVDKTFVAIAVGGTVIAGGAIAGSIIGANIAAITGISIVGGILVIVGVSELVKHTHDVTYIVDGEVYKTYKVVEGTKVPVPADPAKDGFKFEGWNPEVPEKMGETDLVFEAEWSEVSGANDGDADVDVDIPETGSVAGGLAAFAVISGAAAAAYVFTRKKKED